MESPEELEDIVSSIRNGTAVAWEHINMLGEYDFSKLLNNKTLRFDMRKLMVMKYPKIAQKSPCKLLFFSDLQGAILLLARIPTFNLSL